MSASPPNRSHLADAVLPRRESDAARPRAPTAVFVLAVTLSACSILYELLIAQTMAMLAANTVVWYSMVIGAFLGAMGLGAWWSRRLGRRGPWPTLVRIELALTALGAAVVPLVHLGHLGYARCTLTGQAGLAIASFYGGAALLVIAIGVLTGAELPLLMRIAREDRADRGVENVVLGLDYFGSLVGAVLFPLVLLPALPLSAIGFGVALVNLVSAAVVSTFVVAGRRARWLSRLVIAGLAVTLVAGFLHLGRIEQYLLKRYYYYDQLAGGFGVLAPRDDLPDVLRSSSPYQKIDLVRRVETDFSVGLMPAYSDKLARHPGFPVDQVLFLNGDYQTDTRYEEVYHEWFAHVPIVANGRPPRDVLLLGGGDGFLLRELVKYDAIESITHVDIDPTLIELAKTNDVLHRANRDAFRDPRLDSLVTDGYRFVRESERTFDAIYIDFPVAADYDLAKLYSREFFHFVRRRIAPGGFAVFDSTGTSHLTTPNEDGERWISPANDWSIYYHTLRRAGFPTIVPYLTTLELDNQEAREAVLSQIEIEGEVAALEAIDDPAEREAERRRMLSDVVDRLIYSHVISLEQGFVLLAPEEREFSTEWTDLGVDLHLLDAERFALAFDVEFPKPSAVDPAQVNSIMRPTFPTLPWWRPRLPF